MNWVSAGELVEGAKAKVAEMEEAASRDLQWKLGEEALALAERAVAEDPGDAEAHLSVAIVLGKISFLRPPRERIKDSARIRDAALKAVEIDPDYGLAHFVLGRWHYELANLGAGAKFFAEMLFGELPEASNESAVKYLERARDLDGGLMTRAELGRAYLAVGRTEEARAQLRAAVASEAIDADEREAQARARQALQDL
ncbi:MAG: hypothetical protein WA771_00290 [Chthoniobacterales bacterium]